MLQTLKQTTRNTLHTRNILSISVLQKRHATDSERMREYMKARAKERNTITINTKIPRPVFVERENPDTPPAITDSTREIARYMRNTNNLIKLYTIPGLDKEHTKLYLVCVATVNDDKPLTTTKPEQTRAIIHRPIWMLEISNIQPEDKPAFRHDSLFLFDTLSEVYSA